MMSLNEVKMAPGCFATTISSSIRPIKVTHAGQPGPCTSSTLFGRTVLDP